MDKNRKSKGYKISGVPENPILAQLANNVHGSSELALPVP